MRSKLEHIFSYLDNNSIQYFLLRPIDLTAPIKDIDLIIPRSDVNQFLSLLDNDSRTVCVRYSNANESIRVFIDDLLLDIKFTICFLPRKSLIISHTVPYCSVIIKENRYICPDIDDQILFTFWTYHLLLDKVHPVFSSTYEIYKIFYSKSWEQLISSNFFMKWTRLIFNYNSSKAILIIHLLLQNNMSSVNKIDNKQIQKLAIKSNRLIFRFYLDKYYFKFLRLSGFIKKRRSILEVKHKITYEV